jgi:hypothetical protein
VAACLVVIPSICLTRPTNKHNPALSIVFNSAVAAPGFLQKGIEFRLSPKFFSIKALTGINEVCPHLHSKLMWLFVMDANQVMFPSD